MIRTTIYSFGWKPGAFAVDFFLVSFSQSCTSNLLAAAGWQPIANPGKDFRCQEQCRDRGQGQGREKKHLPISFDGHPVTPRSKEPAVNRALQFEHLKEVLNEQMLLLNSLAPVFPCLSAQSLCTRPRILPECLLPVHSGWLWCCRILKQSWRCCMSNVDPPQTFYYQSFGTSSQLLAEWLGRPPLLPSGWQNPPLAQPPTLCQIC